MGSIIVPKSNILCGLVQERESGNQSVKRTNERMNKRTCEADKNNSPTTALRDGRGTIMIADCVNALT